MIDSFENASISVIGCGNIGTQFACACASKGFRVRVYSSRPEAFSGILEIEDENGKMTAGALDLVSDNIGQVVSGSDLIFVAYPAFKLRDAAIMIQPFISPGTGICVLPGTGGAEFAFRNCVDAGAVLYGLQRVPAVARLEQYGRKVRCEGLRNELYVASMPNDRASAFAGFMSELWSIPCSILPNYLNVTLTPSNPILHTTRLRSLFSDYNPVVVYPRNPMFYGEWDMKSSELLLACDNELQNICRALKEMDLSGVKSLMEHYESHNAEEVTRKLCNIKSLHNLPSPMKQVEQGWLPDFESRYFTADFPYGLAIIDELAEIVGVDASNIRETMAWYRAVSGNRSGIKLNDYGITNAEDVYKYYT